MEKFIKLFADAIEREDVINIEDEFRSYDEWNSLAYLSIVVMMNEEYGIQIEQAEFKKLKTVQEIFDLCMKNI